MGSRAPPLTAAGRARTGPHDLTEGDPRDLAELAAAAHVSQARIGVPGSAPLPRQCSQVETASNDTSREAPVSTSLEVTSTCAPTSPPLAGPAGPNPNNSLNIGSPRPKNADSTSSKLPKASLCGAQPPERRPSWPKAS
jgi:hypothetical protein